MDKHKILWVIFSVSLLLIVILAGGLYFLRPIPQDRMDTASQEAPLFQEFDIFEYVRGKQELPGLQTLKTDEEEPEELVIVVGEKVEEKEGKEAVIKAPPKIEQIRPSVKPKPKPPVSTPISKQKPKPAPRQVKVNEYWIQTGSYKSHYRAELMANLLAEQGLAGAITIREIGGQTYYRVRIGPYTSKWEAEKFLSWVKAIQGLESSYVSLVHSKRSIP